MPTISAAVISDTVRELCMAAAYDLPKDVIAAFRRVLGDEKSPRGRAIIETLLKNAEVASAERIPCCVDTGMAVVFVRRGPGVEVEGGTLTAAIADGVRRGFTEGYLRASMVNPPLIERKNTGDNTPPVVHLEESVHPELTITVVLKGSGSENMSRVTMLAPSAGWDGVKREVLDAVRSAGPNPCPPYVLGVGVGGNLEKCAYLAKKALVRDVGEPNPDPRVAALESELLAEVNKTGLGPVGLGGTVTALAVHIEEFPTHIAQLPVAVNFGCHAYRHKTARLVVGGKPWQR